MMYIVIGANDVPWIWTGAVSAISAAETMGMVVAPHHWPAMQNVPNSSFCIKKTVENAVSLSVELNASLQIKHRVDSLPPRKCGRNIRCVIFRYIFVIDV